MEQRRRQREQAEVDAAERLSLTVDEFRAQLAASRASNAANAAPAVARNPMSAHKVRKAPMSRVRKRRVKKQEQRERLRKDQAESMDLD